MAGEDKGNAEFIIPTRFKIKIPSYLSWPLGAKAITSALKEVPQIDEIVLEFYGKIHPKGKWPLQFPVIKVQYSHSITQYNKIEGINDHRWTTNVYCVPRETKSQINDALCERGLKLIVDWLTQNARLTGQENYKRYTLSWDCEAKELSSGKYEDELPQLSRGASKQSK